MEQANGTYHEVTQGETLSGIALKHGFSDYKLIYLHTRNAEFRRKRPNPNVIHLGDLIFIPERDVGAEQALTDVKHRYVLRRPKRLLRIAVEDASGKRLANSPYEILIGADRYKGQTDGNGMIIPPVARQTQEATLKIGNIT